ncbi:MAG: ribonuclease E activity regulator RraA [Caulobacteraceae bacterium]
MAWNTCDLYDRFEAEAQVPDRPLHDYGGRTVFSGRIATVKCFEDNSRLKELSATPGEGRVLVVDGGGSLRDALLGDMIGGDMARNGWAGAVIFGSVRDVEALKGLDFGVRALAATPRKAAREGEGKLGLALAFAGVTWRPGDMLFADADGVLVLSPELAAGVRS